MSAFLNNVAMSKYYYHVYCNCLYLSGHVEVVEFLTRTCKVNPFVKDRSEDLTFFETFTYGMVHVHLQSLLISYVHWFIHCIGFRVQLTYCSALYT